VPESPVKSADTPRPRAALHRVVGEHEVVPGGPGLDAPREPLEPGRALRTPTALQVRGGERPALHGGLLARGDRGARDLRGREAEEADGVDRVDLAEVLAEGGDDPAHRLAGRDAVRVDERRNGA